MLDNEETVQVEVKYNVNVPVENWIDFIVHNVDIYAHNYCGYWLRRVDYDESLGNLVWEDDEQHRRGHEPNRIEAETMWRRGAKTGLPEGWFVLDEATAIKAFIEGCKRWGQEWMDGDHSDSVGYDVVLQMTLLGEIRYG